MRLLYSFLISFLLTSSLFGGTVRTVDYNIRDLSYRANDGGCATARDKVNISEDIYAGYDMVEVCYERVSLPIGASSNGCDRYSSNFEISCTESPNGDSATFGNLDYTTLTYNVLKFTCSNTCEAPDTLNEDTCECVSPPCYETDPLTDCNGDGIPNGEDPEADSNGDGIPNKCDLTHPMYNDFDCDGDGDPNGTDPTPDDGSTKTPEYSCDGYDPAKIEYFGVRYSISDYEYKGYKFPDTCELYLLQDSINGAFEYSDLNPLCIERKYCYINDSSPAPCVYSASDRIPSGYIYNSSAKSEDACQSLVDNIKYDNKIWDIPNSLACPGTAFCFLKTLNAPDSNTDTNSENNDTSMIAPDLNTTSLDLAPLLNASNTTNKHLQDLKDKTDTTNDKLDSLIDIDNKLLASNKDINNNLNSLNSNVDKLVSNSDLSNTTLSNINKALSASNQNTKSIHNDLLSMEADLDRITANTANTAVNTKAIDDTLNDGLFSDIDPFADVDFDDDGTSTFGDLSSDASGSFGLTTESNLFGLQNISGSGLQTYSVFLYGQTITIFEPSMLNGLPIDAIRALILFFSALAGFATIIRTI